MAFLKRKNAVNLAACFIHFAAHIHGKLKFAVSRFCGSDLIRRNSYIGKISISLSLTRIIAEIIGRERFYRGIDLHAVSVDYFDAGIDLSRYRLIFFVIEAKENTVIAGFLIILKAAVSHGRNFWLCLSAAAQQQRRQKYARQ